MGTDDRHLILKFLPLIDLDRKISWKSACVLIGLLVVLLTSAGYYAGYHWVWFDKVNYYDYKAEGFKKVLDKQPGSGGIRAELAMTSYLKGDVQQSINMLREVLSKEPKERRAALYLGLILAEQKEYKESIPLLEKYIKENQDFTTKIAYESLGKSYLGTGQYELALQRLKLAAGMDPGNPRIYYNLGQTYEQLNKPKDAMFSYEKALQISGNYPDAEKALTDLEEKMFKKK